MSFESILKDHADLQARRNESDRQLGTIRAELARDSLFGGKDLMIFCAGSIARKEVGKKSDLDVFVTSTDPKANENLLYQYTLFGRLIDLNKNLGYSEFSNNGRFLKIYNAADVQDKTGTPVDDSENLFTARMLLLLESEYLSNQHLYQNQVKSIVHNYFRDSADKRAFKPLFLLNDILRYWRTLCLNYEQRRKDPSQPWRKKNINLKFARMLTVYSTVLAIVAFPMETEKQILTIVNMTPMDRLVHGLSELKDNALLEGFPAFLGCYENFLKWKEMDDIDGVLKDDELKTTIRQNAEIFSNFIYEALMSQNIKPEYKKYLVI